MQGKTAMVWQLRMWKNGDPQKQLEQCRDLGLDGVLLKIVDGTSMKWGGEPQNYELLPETVAMLAENGIKVGGWGWTYGGRYIARVFTKSKSIARAEGQAHAQACHYYGITEYWIDAETQYDRKGMEEIAEAYMLGFESVPPSIRQYLCSYRFPKTYQPHFPVEAFLPYMEGWAPQVYFLGDNRVDGGARQLETSYRQYMTIGELPYVGVAPTYPWKDWAATKEQLLQFFAKAKEIGCEGISVWDLPQATGQQLAAIREFQWGVVEPPPPPHETPEAIRNEAAAIRGSAKRLDDIAADMEGNQ